MLKICVVLSVDGTPSQIPSFKLTKASAKFEVATSNPLRGDAFTRKYTFSFLTLTLGHVTLGHEQTGNIAQYPMKLLCQTFTINISFDLDQGQVHMKHCLLHHVTYVHIPANF